MTQAWLEQRERGAASLIAFMAWLSRRAGRPVGQALLYPICLYYLTFSDAAKDGSRKYLARALGREPGFRDLFRHYMYFATTLLDRIFFVCGDFAPYDITIHDDSPLFEYARAGKGCLLMGAHIGSFEVMRALGILHEKLPIKVLMYPDNSERFNAVVDRLSPELAKSVISLGRPDALIRAKAHIDGGGIVALLADRSVREGERISIPFLGAPAPFPAGPMMLAAALKVPVMLFFGIYRGQNRYEIHLERFIDAIDGDRAGRRERVVVWLKAYSARLEHYCREVPFNWFNFYDFWAGAE